MCHSWTNNGEMNRFYKRCLRIIYSDRTICNDKTSSFESFFRKDGSVSTQNSNVQVLATEISKSISLSVMKNLFEPKAEHSYNLRYISHVAAPSLSTLFHGTESISSLLPRICSLLPEKSKNFDFLENLKILTKKWKPENCPCRLRKFL